jgi:hypothetical protein
MNRIKTPCVKCRPINDTNEIIVIGPNHSTCYDYLYHAYEMPARVYPDKYECHEGYLCDDDTFVDRVSAMEIAKAANQVKATYNNNDYISLQSYMLKEDFA